MNFDKIKNAAMWLWDNEPALLNTALPAAVSLGFVSADLANAISNNAALVIAGVAGVVTIIGTIRTHWQTKALRAQVRIYRALARGGAS